MFRSDKHAMAARKRSLSSRMFHAGMHQAPPLAVHQHSVREHASAGVVMANGLVLWAVLSVVGVVAWRGVT